MKFQVIHSYDYRPEAIFYGADHGTSAWSWKSTKGGEIGSNIKEQILAVENQA